jgi:hypothetical protein
MDTEIARLKDAHNAEISLVKAELAEKEAGTANNACNY